MLADVLLTILTIIFSLMVVFSKRTVVSAFALLITLLFVGLIYFQLGAVFLSAIQVLVNAGAVAILFVFVMMLINLEETKSIYEHHKLKLGFVALAIFALLASLYVLISGNIEVITIGQQTPPSMKDLFNKLFVDYYLPFEMATVLLLAALVISIVVTGRENANNVE